MHCAEHKSAIFNMLHIKYFLLFTHHVYFELLGLQKKTLALMVLYKSAPKRVHKIQRAVHKRKLF